MKQKTLGLFIKTSQFSSQDHNYISHFSDVIIKPLNCLLWYKIYSNIFIGYAATEIRFIAPFKPSTWSTLIMSSKLLIYLQLIGTSTWVATSDANYFYNIRAQQIGLLRVHSTHLFSMLILGGRPTTEIAILSAQNVILCLNITPRSCKYLTSPICFSQHKYRIQRLRRERNYCPTWNRRCSTKNERRRQSWLTRSLLTTTSNCPTDHKNRRPKTNPQRRTWVRSLADAVWIHCNAFCVGAGRMRKNISEVMHRAFWDCLKSGIESDPPIYDHAFVLLQEIKGILLSLLPKERKTVFHQRYF